jgi:acyl dehydratase
MSTPATTSSDSGPASALIRNRIYDEIEVGDSASLMRTLTREDIELFAIMSGDVNPAHVDEEFARGDMFHHIIAHGMWGASLISTVLGTELPGPGTIYLEQTLKFRAPIAPGDTVVATVTVREKSEKHHVTLDCKVETTTGTLAIEGSARILAPTQKVSRPRITLPRVSLDG